MVIAYVKLLGSTAPLKFGRAKKHPMIWCSLKQPLILTLVISGTHQDIENWKLDSQRSLWGLVKKL